MPANDFIPSSPKDKSVIGKIMKEFHEGKLKTKGGKRISSRTEAKLLALSIAQNNSKRLK